MEELLKDEKAKQMLKDLMFEYIKDNLRIEAIQYQNGNFELDVWLDSSHIQHVETNY